MSLKSFGKEVINAYSQGKPVLRAYSNGKLAYRQQQEIVYSAKVKTAGAYVDTEYVANEKTKITLKVLSIAPASGCLVGGRPDVNVGASAFTFFPRVDNLSSFRLNNTETRIDATELNSEKLIEFSQKGIYYDGVLKATIQPVGVFSTQASVALFVVKGLNGLAYFATAGYTIASQVVISETQEDGSEIIKRNLYFVPAGDTQHSAIPAPAGGACWCRVTNRYYNVLQNNGVGELEYEPISVNKNPRTEYSCEALTADMFETPLTVPTDATVKFVTSLKTLEGYTTLLRLNDSSTIDIGVNLYVENGTTVKLQHNGATYEAPYAFAIDTDYTFAITPTSLKINGVDVLTYPVRTYPVDTLTWYCNLTNVLKSSILVYNTSPIAELIPVPQSDVQYSDIPAPVGGALWDRVTNKYYAKQGTGALKFTPLPRLALVSTGTQWISTGIAGNTITLASIRHKITDKTKRQLHGYNVGTGYFGYNGSSEKYELSSPVKLSDIIAKNYDILCYTLKFNNSYLSINSITQLSAIKDESTNPLNWLTLIREGFDYQMSANTTNAFIYVGNTLTQNLIPVKQGDTFHKKDSTPAPSNCMYDTVTDTYFQNAGTGTFGTTYE